ncbi:putative signal peptide protein [Puccinia sorghi]|uniref:Putative signal peptide protein n=1 Tax=Puccinia sorghi TaxID=27349 RepID=A0A0L6VP32_9BASI|nr:putative signal peptide protein [Puccinia sorghi]
MPRPRSPPPGLLKSVSSVAMVMVVWADMAAWAWVDMAAWAWEGMVALSSSYNSNSMTSAGPFGYASSNNQAASSSSYSNNYGGFFAKDAQAKKSTNVTYSLAAFWHLSLADRILELILISTFTSLLLVLTCHDDVRFFSLYSHRCYVFPYYFSFVMLQSFRFTSRFYMCIFSLCRLVKSASELVTWYYILDATPFDQPNHNVSLESCRLKRRPMRGVTPVNPSPDKTVYTPNIGKRAIVTIGKAVGKELRIYMDEKSCGVVHIYFRQLYIFGRTILHGLLNAAHHDANLMGTLPFPDFVGEKDTKKKVSSGEDENGRSRGRQIQVSVMIILSFLLIKLPASKNIYCTMRMIYGDKNYLIQFSRIAATTGRSDSFYPDGWNGFIVE